MKSKDPIKKCDVRIVPERSREKTFWDYSDKFFEFIGTNTFTYISVGLLLVGVILGVIANLLGK